MKIPLAVHARAALATICTVLMIPPAFAVECGDSLGPGGVFRLDRDLECDGGTQPAVTLLSGARLDLGQHTIRCTNPIQQRSTGVRLEGTGAIVHDGTVTGCKIGIDSVEGGRHVLTRLSLSVSTGNLLNIQSDGNVIFDNRATEGDWAFAILGNENLVVSNRSVKAFGSGFFVGGSGNVVYDNSAIASGCSNYNIPGSGNRLAGNTAEGNVLAVCMTFEIAGANNLLIGNRASNSMSDGFALLGGTGNRLIRNTARDNWGAGIRVADGSGANVLLRNDASANRTFDLQDDNPDCDANTWKANRFDTRNASCIE